MVTETELQEIIAKRKSGRRGEGQSDGMNLPTQLLDVIAEGHPVSTTRFAQRTGLDAEAIDEIFSRMRNGGSEFNADGDLVGNVPTQIPAPHHFNLSGKELYASCALETLFLPGLMRRTTQVRVHLSGNRPGDTIECGPRSCRKLESQWDCPVRHHPRRVG